MIRMSLDQSKERAIEVKASDGDAAAKLTRAQSVTRRTNLASQACAARSWLSEPWFVSNYIFLPSFIFFFISPFLPSPPPLLCTEGLHRHGPRVASKSGHLNR